LPPPPLGIDINRLQLTRLICKRLSNFVYILPDVECIHQSNTFWHSMHIHINSVFSLPQPPRPLGLTKVASATSVGISIQGDIGAACERNDVPRFLMLGIASFRPTEMAVIATPMYPSAEPCSLLCTGCNLSVYPTRRRWNPISHISPTKPSQSLSSCIPAKWQRLRSTKLHSKFNFTFVATSSTMHQVQSLPTVLPESFNTSGKILEIRSAYSMSVLLEQAASSYTDPKIRERKLIHARVLGHLLREAPSMQASENVANQVNSCQNNDQLDALGEMYFLHYICACEPPCPPVVSATLIPCGQSGCRTPNLNAPGLHGSLLLITRLLRPKGS
jgi:hypothetical protein